MSDWYLLAIIAGIVLVDVIILITWEIVDPLKENEVKVFEERVRKKLCLACYLFHRQIYTTYAMLSSGIPWNMPRVTCVFRIHTNL